MSNRSVEEFLPFAVPCIGDEEIDEVIDTLRSGWLTTGPKTKDFERRFADYVGAQHAVAVNSATAGLHLALEAIGVGRGDKVITSTFTFTATAEVIRYLGADPVFVDVDETTLNLSAAQVAEELSGHDEIKAILPVHFAGQAADMDSLCGLSGKFNVDIVEDAAHAFPTTYGGRMIGTIGEATVFSFYATKTIATGEGGMLTTDNPALAERARVMRLHGINRDVFDRYTSDRASWYYEVVAPGFKYNMTDVAAAIGIHQLQKAERFRARRQEIAEYYTKELANLPVETPITANPEDMHAWHLYVIRLLEEETLVSRDEFIQGMADRGVGTSVHFIPLHMQPYWRDRYNLKNSDFPIATRAFRRVVSLPIYPNMRDQDCEKVVSAIKSILAQTQ